MMDVSKGPSDYSAKVVPSDSYSKPDVFFPLVVRNIQDDQKGKGGDSNLPEGQEVLKAVEQAQKVALALDRSLRFEFKEDADLYQVIVMEVDKKELEGERVVRKIPSDEVVNFVEHIKDMFGALLDLKA